MNLLSNCEPVLAFLIACSAKATVLLALTWMITVALRRQSAAVRHRKFVGRKSLSRKKASRFTASTCLKYADDLAG